MSTIWHIIQKDFRRFRWPLVALVLIWALKAGLLLRLYISAHGEQSFPMALNGEDLASSIMDSSSRYVSDTLHGFTFVGSFMDLYLLIYIVVNLLQGDSAFDERAFWRTRPVSRKQMLAAKALFLILAVWLVPLIFQATLDLLYIPFWNDIVTNSPSKVSHIIHWYDGVMRVALIQGGWAMAGILVASLWRNPVVGFGSLVGLLMWLFILAEGMHAKRTELSPTALESFWLGGSALIFCAMYLRGSRKLGFTLFGLGTALVFVLPFFR